MNNGTAFWMRFMYVIRFPERRKDSVVWHFRHLTSEDKQFITDFINKYGNDRGN